MSTLATHVLASCVDASRAACEDTSSSSAPVILAIAIGAVVLGVVVLGVLIMLRSTRRR